VDERRLGAMGVSLGGNSVLYSLLLSDQFGAAIAIQPMTPNIFAFGFGRDLLGPFWTLVDPVSRLFYRVVGGFKLDLIDPVLIAPSIRVPVLFIQGKGDRWGSADNVAAMALACLGAVEPVFPETSERYGGYHWVLAHPERALDFFDQHLGAGAGATPDLWPAPDGSALLPDTALPAAAEMTRMPTMGSPRPSPG